MTTQDVSRDRPAAPTWFDRHMLARLLVMTGATFGLYLLLEIAIALALPRALPWRDIRLAIAALAACAIMLGAYRLLLRGVERRSAIELSPRPGAGYFLLGLTTGAALFTVVLAILALLGLATFGGFGGPAGVLQALSLSLVSAVGEEIVFRGCLFRILEQGFGSTPALVVSAALFGLIHLIQPGASAVSTIAIALEAGVLLALTYAAARSLWLPIGVHFGWNFAEGGIFSQAVSGGRSEGLVEVGLKGPQLLTGGAFGPEASVVAVAVSLVASAVLIAIVVRSGRWRPAFPRAATR